MKKIFMTAFAVLLLVTITGLSQAAQKVITQYSNAAVGVAGGVSPPYIPAIGDMGDPIVTATGAVTTTPTAINLGGSIYDAAGAIWYKGDSDLAYCTSGACVFGTGLRAFFNFQFTTQDSTDGSTNSADGFVFAISNSILNTDGSGIPNRTGGAPAICAATHVPNYNCSMGELMGYAGPGTTADKLGIRPPKMGIEFDIYPNGPGTDICNSGSRNDSPFAVNAGNSSFRNHIALMFWGDNLTGNYCTYGGTNFDKISFDDNRHGSGNNSSNPGTATPSSGYYQGPFRKTAGGYNWMEDGQPHQFRIEIDRSTKTDGSGNGLYTTRVWVDCNGTSCSTSGEATRFQDVVNQFPLTDSLPQINRTVELSQADHILMDRILFGFTEATGAATQIATITNFMIYFPKTLPAPPCTYTLSASDNSATPLGAASGSYGTVNVIAGSGCTWPSSSNNGNTWITISPTSGSGNGSVTYTANTANTGGLRSANITIAGQPFTVWQAAPIFNCTGGTETTAGGKKIHTYTTVGTSSLVCTGSGSAEVLVVGGGGAGGGRHGGGGGAGGLVYNLSYSVTGNISVTVGAGGNPTQTNPNEQSVGGNGGNSVFGSMTALGGGGGGSYTAAVPTGGGSGGGGGGGQNKTHGLKNQGNSGGGTGFGSNGGDGGTTTGGGGGGGAGGVGSNAAGADTGGNGGVGKAYSISGISVYYAGGGGGGGVTAGGTGGSGVGGNGGNNSGTAGTANTGGGGGGVRSLTVTVQGKAGGSGVVIISY